MPRLPELLIAPADPGPLDPPELRGRRRVVTAVTLVVGAALLGATLGAPRGSVWFFTFAALVALTWVLGAIASGPLRLGRPGGRASGPRGIGPPIVAAIAAFSVFLAIELVARDVPVLSGALHRVLATADAGPVILVLVTAIGNGVAEEVFFRGALPSALGRHHPTLYSTIAYVAVTAATRNLALVLAALVMGTLWALERRSTGGVLAPILTHTIWSSLMLLALPR